MNKHIQKFKEDKFCIIKNVISPDMCSFISQYALFDEMQNFDNRSFFDDGQVPNAYSKYSDPAMESMLILLKKYIEENTGLKVYPTYSYFRIYRNGDELLRHTDRPACEISATLCFKHSYDKDKYKWPIYIDSKKIFLDSGDMAIYRGCELQHWRFPMEAGKHDWHVQGFFHYVDVNGPYADWKYDRRKTPGRLTKE